LVLINRLHLLWFTLFFLFIAITAAGQTLGGAGAYNFLQLPASPLLSAAGGVNISSDPGDVAFALNNPALPPLFTWRGST
jgi:hypothetical protein